MWVEDVWTVQWTWLHISYLQLVVAKFYFFKQKATWSEIEDCPKVGSNGQIRLKLSNIKPGQYVDGAWDHWLVSSYKLKCFGFKWLAKGW